jgi:hypothetical protein
VLSAKGAALVDATQSPSAKAAVRRYGGVDAMVISPEHSGALDEFVPLLERAPFGGKLLCSGSSPTVSPNEVIVAEVAPNSEMIVEALVRSLRDHRRST